LTIEISKIESTQQITIDNISGYEIIAIGKDKKRVTLKKVIR